MLNIIRSQILGIGKKIITSISFIPTVTALILIMLAIFLIAIDSPEKDWFITEALPILDISYADTARDLVTTFLAGTISLIIFSFTMMMFVLQQAASNYSSKIIGGIISRKSNQIILGTYVGTIIYMILILIQIKEDDKFEEVPQLPIFVGLIIFILCVILFVKFINDIYDSVQIYQVIEGIYHKTVKRLNIFPGDEGQLRDFDKDQHWYTYYGQISGYFQDISKNSMVSIARKHDLIIEIIPPKGFYHAIGEPLFKLNQDIKDKDIIKNIESSFIFYSGENISDNSFYGIRQLSEVAVQSLSTGINAPGIAIACLDYLGDLFILLTKNNRTQIIRDKKKMPRIIIQAISLQEMMEMCITPIRIYGKKDLNIMISLLNLFKRIGYNDKLLEYHDVVIAQFNGVLEDSKKSLENSMDKKSLYESVQKIKKEVPWYFNSERY
jgi:uncharacterized membrane protein